MTQTKTNYELFIETVHSLKDSQGFYQRLWNSIQKLQEKKQLEIYFNGLYIKFYDCIDVINWIESYYKYNCKDM